MGLYVHLYVNRHNLTPESWEQVYLQTLALLEKFPLPLHRTKIEQLLGQRRYVYTSQLVADENTANEHWSVEGDALSDKRGEQFYLYRYPWQRNPESSSKYPEKSILWQTEDKINQLSSGSGDNIFGGTFGTKTEGYPYHLAMLMVGILIENRFPNHAMVNGDIDAEQAQACVDWMNSILDEPVTLPICVDATRLYQQLATIYPDSKQTITRFNTLSCDTEEKQLQTIIQLADNKVVTQYLLNKLQRYTELEQQGAIKLIFQYLLITQDICQTIDLITQARQQRPKFTLETLLTLLGNHFISIEPQQREILNIFATSSDELQPFDDIFIQTCFNLGLKATDFYIDSQTLLDIFNSYRPSKKATFKQILSDCEQHCHEQLDLLKAKWAEIELQQPLSEQEIAQLAVYSEQEKYFVKQAYLQQTHFLQAEDAAQQMASDLSQIIQENQSFLTEDSAENYLAKIYYMSHANGFSLSEQAWQRIDNEFHTPILQRLLALSLIKSPDQHFTQWRGYFMEHANLWEILCDNEK